MHGTQRRPVETKWGTLAGNRMMVVLAARGGGQEEEEEALSGSGSCPS